MRNLDCAKTVVIKVGTSTLTYATGMLNLRRIESLITSVCDLQNEGRRIIFVSSGAVSAGLAKIGLLTPEKIEDKQAAAAVGQCELLNLYATIFARYGHKIAQVLITKDVLENETMRINAENTFHVLLDLNCIPVVNENDTISFEGLKFGGNDTLSAYVAMLAKADLIINLSDVDGLFDSNPRTNPKAKLIPYVAEIDDSVMDMAGGTGTVRGTGGMQAKLLAAKLAVQAGIPMMIANGTERNILYDIFDGKEKGTYFDVCAVDNSEY